jgi:hypothetical protein
MGYRPISDEELEVPVAGTFVSDDGSLQTNAGASSSGRGYTPIEEEDSGFTDDSKRGFIDTLGITGSIEKNIADPSRMLGTSFSPEGGLIKSAWQLATGKTDFMADEEKKAHGMDAEERLFNSQLSEMEAAGNIDTPDYLELWDTLQAIRKMKVAEPDFTWDGFYNAVASDPGATAAEFINIIARDPELMYIPGGWRAAAVKTLAKTGSQTAAVVAGAAAGAATNAAAMTALVGAEELAQKGEINYELLAMSAKMGAGFGAFLGGGATGVRAIASQAVSGNLNKIWKTVTEGTTRTADDLDKAFRGKVGRGESIGDALKDILEEVGAGPKAASYEAAAKWRAPTFTVHDKVNKVTEGIRKGIAKSQAGKVSPELAVIAGAGAIGGAINYQEEYPILSTMIGAGAVIGSLAAARALGKTLLKSKELRDVIVNKPLRITDEVLSHDGNLDVIARHVWQDTMSIREALAADARRAMSHFMEGTRVLDGELLKLSAGEAAMAPLIRKLFDDVHGAGKAWGITDTYLENYITHMWRQGSKSISQMMEALKPPKGGGMSTRSPYGKHRVFETLEFGKADKAVVIRNGKRVLIKESDVKVGEKIIEKQKGLVPTTEDIADIYYHYATSMLKAIENKKLITSLMSKVDSQHNKLIMLAHKAPDSYVQIKHPSLDKWSYMEKGKLIKLPVSVHPEIADSMKMIFQSTERGTIMRGSIALNYFMKRSLVSFSAFHANALMESYLMAGANPIKGLWNTGAVMGNRALKKVGVQKKIPLTEHSIYKIPEMLRYGKVGDDIDKALRAGLKLGTIEDVGTDVFYGVIRDLQGIADRMGLKYIAGSKGAMKLAEKANLAIDNIMWNKIATGAKLVTYMVEMERAIAKQGKLKWHKPWSRHASSAERPEQVIAREVAEFVNDAFGGLNWKAIAEGVESKFARTLTMETLSPQGRQWLQLGMFAPDWTISNIRILGKALFAAKSGEQAMLHRLYALRGAFYVATIADGINKMMSGHHLWENPEYGGRYDRMDFGNGWHVTYSKQINEPFHWLFDFTKTAVNKVGLLPKKLMEQFLHKDYINANYSPDMHEKGAGLAQRILDHVKNIGKSVGPIAASQTSRGIEQGGTKEGFIAGLAGFGGHPATKKDTSIAARRKEQAKRRKER